ncbi:Melibiose/raffinose/stachyose import permease protein MelD [subsurface metagenome]
MIGIAFVLPSTLVLLLMMVFPVLQTFIFSFSNIELPYFELSFAGFDNYIKAFSRPEVPLIIKNTIIWTVFFVLMRTSLGLASALVMNAKVKGILVLRLLALLPWTVPSIVSANVWRWILQSDFGVINGTLRVFGLDKFALLWLGSTTTALPSVLTAITWVGYPFVMMVLLSAMQDLPKELYEAAEIDGANGFNLFRYITLPGIKPVLFVVFALELMNAINTFDMIFIMTGGGPGGVTEIFSLFIYRLAFLNLDFASGSAVSSVLIIVTLLGFCLFGPVQRSIKKKEEY